MEAVSKKEKKSHKRKVEKGNDSTDSTEISADTVIVEQDELVNLETLQPTAIAATTTADTKEKRPLPKNYKCNACGAIDDHAIYDCSLKRKEKKSKPAVMASSAITQSPAAITTVHINSANSSNTSVFTLYVTGLPFEITKPQLFEFFKSHDCTQIGKINLLPFEDNPTKCRGVAFIEAKDFDTANKAISLTGLTIGESTKTIRIEHASKDANSVKKGDGKSKGATGGMAGARCYRCGETGHLPATCSNKRICYKCKSTEHISKDCPKRATK